MGFFIAPIEALPEISVTDIVSTKHQSAKIYESIISLNLTCPPHSILPINVVPGWVYMPSVSQAAITSLL